MIDDFTNLGIIKLRLLAEGVRFDRSIFAHPGDYMQKRYYFAMSDHVPVGPVRPPQELLLGDGLVVVGVSQRPQSPWLVRRLDSGIALLEYKDEPVATVRFPAPPAFYGQSLQDGQPAEQILSFYGAYVLAAFVKGWCDLWSKNLQCHFCSLNATRKSIHDGAIRITPDAMEAAVQTAFVHDRQRIACVMYCGGSFLDRDREICNYLQLVKAANQASASYDIHHHLLAMPPASFDLFHELLEAGIDDMGMSLEVWDPDLFRAICPGKSSFVGHDGYLRAFEAAVKVFGRGRVYCVFVGGMEEEASMFQGFETLAAMGVVPSVNVFHPDPAAKMGQRQQPDSQYVFDIAQYLGRVYREHNFFPAVCGLNRNSLDAEGSAGFFEPDFDPSHARLGRLPGRQAFRRAAKGQPGFFDPQYGVAQRYYA